MKGAQPIVKKIHQDNSASRRMVGSYGAKQCGVVVTEESLFEEETSSHSRSGDGSSSCSPGSSSDCESSEDDC